MVDHFPPTLPLIFLCGLGSCVAPTVSIPELTAGEAVVLQTLPKGTRVELLATTFSGADTPPREFVAGLWQAAMGQAETLDIAAGVESCPSPTRIALHFDSGSRTFTTTLQRDGQAPLGLAAVEHTATGPSLDRLAYKTRVALGDTAQRPPVPSTDAFSTDPQCVVATQLGLAAQARGELTEAIRLFERARSADPRSPTLLLHLAAAMANQPTQGSSALAQRTATAALTQESRLTPNCAHRLARLLLLLEKDDEELLKLGRRFRVERPHDPHGAYTEALALNHTGHQAEALPMLRSLRLRWPRHASVTYELCLALLAEGEAVEALDVLEDAAPRLSPQVVVWPRILALFHSGKHDELGRYLDQLRRGVQGTPAELEIIRIQASHELLTDNRGEAVRLLGESLAWIRQRGSLLAQMAPIIAEDGAVLAHLGEHRTLAQIVDGFEQLGELPPTVTDALTYLRSTGLRAADAVAPRDATAADSWVLATLHALTDAGGTDPAIADQVRERLMAFDQRRPREHPLMTPGRALAWSLVR